MASSVIHLAITSQAAEKIGINDKKLFLGSILPDFATSDNSHYRVEDHKTKYKTIDLFKICDDLFTTAEKDDMAVIGYYLHVMQDRMFCRFLIEQCGYQICTENTKKLYHDYKLLNRFIIDKYELLPLMDMDFIPEDSFLNRKFRFDETKFRKSLQEYSDAEAVCGNAYFLTCDRAEKYIKTAVEATVNEFDAVIKGNAPYDKVPYYWKRTD